MKPKLLGLGLGIRLGIFRKYLSTTASVFKSLVLRVSKFEDATDGVQIFIKQIPGGPNVVPYSLAA